ncbi:MAG: hydrolase [archaeon]
MEKGETGCCPRFAPKGWDGKILKWKGKKFVKGSVLTLFYIPLNFGQVISGLMKKISAAGAKSPGWMGLSDHTSLFNMDIYVAVDRKVPALRNVELSGKFFSKVYEGDFKETGKWCGDFSALAKKKGFKIGKLYMWYTTCPKCAKAYGKNYVVIVGKIG